MQIPTIAWYFVIWFNLFLMFFVICVAIWLYQKFKHYNPLAKGA